MSQPAATPLATNTSRRPSIGPTKPSDPFATSKKEMTDQISPSSRRTSVAQITHVIDKNVEEEELFAQRAAGTLLAQLQKQVWEDSTPQSENDLKNPWGSTTLATSSSSGILGDMKAAAAGRALSESVTGKQPVVASASEMRASTSGSQFWVRPYDSNAFKPFSMVTPASPKSNSGSPRRPRSAKPSPKVGLGDEDIVTDPIAGQVQTQETVTLSADKLERNAHLDQPQAAAPVASILSRPGTASNARKHSVTWNDRSTDDTVKAKEVQEGGEENLTALPTGAKSDGLDITADTNNATVTATAPVKSADTTSIETASSSRPGTSRRASRIRSPTNQRSRQNADILAGLRNHVKAAGVLESGLSAASVAAAVNTSRPKIHHRALQDGDAVLMISSGNSATVPSHTAFFSAIMAGRYRPIRPRGSMAPSGGRYSDYKEPVKGGIAMAAEKSENSSIKASTDDASVKPGSLARSFGKKVPVDVGDESSTGNQNPIPVLWVRHNDRLRPSVPHDHGSQMLVHPSRYIDNLDGTVLAHLAKCKRSRNCTFGNSNRIAFLTSLWEDQQSRAAAREYGRISGKVSKEEEDFEDLGSGDEMTGKARPKGPGLGNVVEIAGVRRRRRGKAVEVQLQAGKEGALGISLVGGSSTARRTLCAPTAFGRVDGKIISRKENELNSFEQTTAERGVLKAAAQTFPLPPATKRVGGQYIPKSLQQVLNLDACSSGESMSKVMFIDASAFDPSRCIKPIRSTRFGMNTEYNHETRLIVQAEPRSHFYISEDERWSHYPYLDTQQELHRQQYASKLKHIIRHKNESSVGELLKSEA
ncbi:hypothetical protein HDU76_007441 [Blyttiomyces sp. JEL0837]|nr:hypothetical protein HDU76_007441 [Blyttiomyces sp. JEL0837]